MTLCVGIRNKPGYILAALLQKCKSWVNQGLLQLIEIKLLARDRHETILFFLNNEAYLHYNKSIFSNKFRDERELNPESGTTRDKLELSHDAHHETRLKATKMLGITY